MGGSLREVRCLGAGVATPLSVRLTWLIVRDDGGWKIVSYHVSSETPLIER